MALKTVLVTGCSAGGIGDSLAQAFHERGLRVWATARNLAKVEHLKAMGMDILPLDVVDPESLKSAVKAVTAETGGKLDILVNNSGGGYNMPLLDADLSEAKKMFDVNVFALIGTTQAFAPLLIAAQGTVINIGSVVGYAPVAWQGFYNASKAAVNMLSDNLRIEMAPFNVKVICVVTGGVRTHFYDNVAPTKLPPNSLYSANAESIENSHAISIKGFVDVDVYVKQVVKNALKTNPNVRQWAGGSIWSVWFASTFLWHTAWDLFIPDMYGVTDFKKRWLAQKKGN